MSTVVETRDEDNANTPDVACPPRSGRYLGRVAPPDLAGGVVDAAETPRAPSLPGRVRSARSPLRSRGGRSCLASALRCRGRCLVDLRRAGGRERSPPDEGGRGLAGPGVWHRLGARRLCWPGVARAPRLQAAEPGKRLREARTPRSAAGTVFSVSLRCATLHGFGLPLGCGQGSGGLGAKDRAGHPLGPSTLLAVIHA